MKNLLVKPNNSEEHSIYIEAEVDLLGIAYETRQIEIIEDMYSPSVDLRLNQRNIKTSSNKKITKSTFDLQEKINVSDTGVNNIYSAEVIPVISNYSIVNGKVIYTGNLEIRLTYESHTSKMIDCKSKEVPFNFEVNIENINSQSNIDTEIEILSKDFIILTDGQVDSRVKMQFNIFSERIIEIEVIDGIEISENNEKDCYSMTIYFVKPGDTIWKIAKQFKSTVQEIVQVNEIEDENKINIGQQLFIPKAV